MWWLQWVLSFWLQCLWLWQSNEAAGLAGRTSEAAALRGLMALELFCRGPALPVEFWFVCSQFLKKIYIFSFGIFLAFLLQRLLVPWLQEAWGAGVSSRLLASVYSELLVCILSLLCPA